MKVITTQLEGDREKVSRAILLGSAIPLLMFVAWNLAIVGSVPPDALASFADGAAAAAASGLPPPPPFDPLEQLRGGEGGPFLSVAVSTFSEFAIVTSFIGFAYGACMWISLCSSSSICRISLCGLVYVD